MVVKRFLTVLLCVLVASIAYAGPQSTSGTTGTNLIAQARVYLDEPNTAIKRWTEAELLQFLNDGTLEIASKTHCYQATEAITLVANTVEYTPTTDYISVVAVVCNPASGTSWGLVKGNISSQGKGTNDTKPLYWYEFAGKVGIYPAYSSVTTETATAYFVKRPAAIAAGGTVPTPVVFDRALVYYIVVQAYLKDKRIAEANNYLMLYTAELDRYRKDFMEVDNETIDPIR